jgi:PIN domain nuclease of toxin-antitoxin system
MSLLLDTCAVLWLAADPERMSAEARKRLTDPSTSVYVSAISAGELACLVQHNRVVLPRHWKPWFRQAVADNGWEVLPVDLDVVEEAYSLPENFHTDPADRMIVASARLKRLTVVTGDQRILEYPHVDSLA